MSSLRAVVENLIAQNDVMIFSKTYCPYCTKVKKLFETIAVPYKALELDNEEKGAAIQKELEVMTKQRTVPNVFIKGKHLGGCDDTHEAHANGTLSKLLK